MRTCYVIPEQRVIADLVPPGELTRDWTITRINVPDNYRGLGLGSQMLKRILEDADSEGVAIQLEPSPSGPLSYSSLVDWYARYGFRFETTGYMRRAPRRNS